MIRMRSAVWMLALIVVGVPLFVSCVIVRSSEPGRENVLRMPLSSLEVSGVFDVEIREGNSNVVTIDCPDELLKKVIYEQEGSGLKLSSRRDRRFGRVDVLDRSKDRRRSVIKVVVTTTRVNNLKEIDMDRASNLTFKTNQPLDELDIELSGASDAELALKARKLDLDISQASELNFKGGADEMEVDLSGSSDMNIDATVGKMKGDLSGSSSIQLRGQAESMSMDLSGSSDIEGHAMRVTVASIELSGSSDATVYVVDALSVQASGNSSLRYKGNPRLDVSSSGGSTIKPLDPFDE